MVVDDGSSAMVVKVLFVALKRVEKHQKRSPKSKDMTKRNFQKLQFSASTAGKGGSTAPSTAQARQKAVFEVPREVVPLGAVVPLYGAVVPLRDGDFVPETQVWPIWAEILARTSNWRAK